LKVLVIDDDIVTTEMLKMTLEPASFKVNAASSSHEGIELARRWKPDIIIVDLVMPVLNGWEVCKEIRKFSSVPILVMSVMNQPEMVAKTLDQGADDYLVKPVSTSILIAHLNKLTRRSRSEFDALPIDNLTNP
jgi:DNA-binding response OmpR family regulator